MIPFGGLLMNWLETQPNRHPRTASRLVDGEAVIVLPEEGTVKVLNSVGSRIWELADGAHLVRDIVETIYQEYDVDRDQAEEEVVAFVTEMVGDELMVVEGGA
jgi:hypothetical protein